MHWMIGCLNVGGRLIGLVADSELRTNRGLQWVLHDTLNYFRIDKCNRAQFSDKPDVVVSANIS